MPVKLPNSSRTPPPPPERSRPGRLFARPQSVTAPATRSAIFLVLTVNEGSEHARTVRSELRSVPSLVESLRRYAPTGGLSCVVGIGSKAWDRLFGSDRPRELREFREIRAGGRHAVSTPGDLLFHLRADRPDLCYELERQLLARLGRAVAPQDEEVGFRYFENRNLLGFVDGSENPRGRAARKAVLVGPEDPEFAGGSYAVVQKYLHDLPGWEALPRDAQERIVGRTKRDDRELEDGAKPPNAHIALTSISEGGSEVKILRDSMPFGRPARREVGTYFIGYCRSPRPLEQMLENMFVGKPPGHYDRLLDYSRPVTGGLFFVPAASFLSRPQD